MNGLRITDIIIYPVKSLSGISLDQSYARIRGFELDRRWMLTDGSGNFLSQRKLPQMAAFKVKLLNDALEVSYHNEKINIPFDGPLSKWMPVRLWKSRLSVPVYSRMINEWFSDHLGLYCHLVRMIDQVNRPVSGKYAVNNETVSFADGFPYLAIGNSSLNELNRRLDRPVPMDRFRPNLVFEKGDPFAEDHFDEFTAGDVRFKAVKPCGRCVVTTVDQNTGKKGKEPLVTLSGFRKKDNKILFGQNLICLDEGKVSVGDLLILLD